jgi:hypothetical protein
MWKMAASSRWHSLCDALREYNSPLEQVALPRDRKWEIVSALQKSIRRGDGSIALRVLSAAIGLHEDYAYIWRRLCVTACEDIGPADDVLVSFVIACANVFPPRTIAAGNHAVWSFLVDQMCGLATRSRIYCSCGIIDPVIATDQLSKDTEEDGLIVATLLRNRDELRQATSPHLIWQKKNDWRTEGLLRYVGLTLPFDVMRSGEPIPSSITFLGLPSYCYDMHTRVGLKMLQRLVYGNGAPEIREFFRDQQVKNAHRAVGAALFFEEGGRIKGELAYEPLCALEQRVFARQHGLALENWWNLRDLVRKALEKGVIDAIREEVLRHQYGQGNLQLIATDGEGVGHASN